MQTAVFCRGGLRQPAKNVAICYVLGRYLSTDTMQNVAFYKECDVMHVLTHEA